MTGYAADNAANATTVNVVLLSALIIIPSSLADLFGITAWNPANEGRAQRATNRIALHESRGFFLMRPTRSPDQQSGKRERTE